MRAAANDDFRTGALDVVPDLLELAREMLRASSSPGDEDVERLKTLLEECVVQAHRVRLRERLSAVRGSGERS